VNGQNWCQPEGLTAATGGAKKGKSIAFDDASSVGASTWARPRDLLIQPPPQAT